MGKLIEGLGSIPGAVALFAMPVLLAVIQGCAYQSYTTKLDRPILRISPEPRYESVFDVRPEGEEDASIGDELFRISRYQIARVENVMFNSPTSHSFPNSAAWKGTYVYNDGRSHFFVYTAPGYHGGHIGVILDSNERLATREPLVQVEGSKKGRRWGLRGTGKFFAASNELIEQWGLRYGGMRDKNFVFHLFDKSDANVTEILQSIEITESGFLRGFTVRNVVITGIETDVQGVIRYKVRDALKEGS
jgi:hypothetical protein